MDTLYNSLSGPFIQTLIFEKSLLMFGVLHKERTSQSMANSFDYLEDIFGHDLFRRFFHLVLTDRGSEFEKVDLFEFNTVTGEARLKMFYCDPMASHQKPHVENNHNFVRDIIPNGVSLDNFTQDDIDLMFSHINSTPRESLDDKTPYEVFEFLHSNNNSIEILNLLNIEKIEKDKVILKPYLLKKPKK